MTTLKFDALEVARLMDHALAAKKHRKAYAFIKGRAKAKPGLLFVHDDGLYLMSNGEPRLARQDRPEWDQVAYAKGYNPDTDGDVWDKCRDAVGGDDFAEEIPITPQLAEEVREKAEFFFIKVEEAAADGLGYLKCGVILKKGQRK